MMKKSPLIAFMLALSLRHEVSVDAFLASSPSSPVHGPIHIAASSSSPSSSQLQFFSGFEMGGMDAVNDENTNQNDKSSSDSTLAQDESQDALFIASLVTKAIIILIIKMAKDIVNYPPNLLDQYNRYQQMKNQEIAMSSSAAATEFAECEEEEEECLVVATAAASTSEPMVSQTPLPLELTKTNPFILLAKFLGVLTYKSMHDSIYYPALWIHNYLYPPRNNDDDYYYYY